VNGLLEFVIIAPVPAFYPNVMKVVNVFLRIVHDASRERRRGVSERKEGSGEPLIRQEEPSARSGGLGRFSSPRSLDRKS
jgi:hypothetical protein